MLWVIQHINEKFNRSGIALLGRFGHGWDDRRQKQSVFLIPQENLERVFVALGGSDAEGICSEWTQLRFPRGIVERLESCCIPVSSFIAQHVESRPHQNQIRSDARLVLLIVD